MTFGIKRAGAAASAMVLLAAGYGTYGVVAVAQDQLDQDAAATAPAEADADLEANTQNPIRFVSSEVVQDVPQIDEITPAPAVEAASLRELVSATLVEGEMSREMRCLAQAVYFESRGEPLDGQLAVAQVVINRADSSVFPDDYCSVVTQRAQFSFVRGGRIPQPNTASAAWDRARAIARIAHRELWESEVDDALYFHANYVSPRWARHKTARARINTHIFYR